MESVKCRRILLARKTIVCSQRLDKAQAVEEVAHLTRLQHAHILRVIGTYVVGRELSILLYPVAEYDLERFLGSMRDTPEDLYGHKSLACRGFFACLCDAVAYIHSRLTKHMDIKAKNILVKHTGPLTDTVWRDMGERLYKVYIADFGIARSYDRPEDISTDGRTLFTPKYAAPEVIEQDMRGLSADIFSLGCVYLEMSTVLCDLEEDWRARNGLGQDNQNTRCKRWQELQNILNKNKHNDKSYQANIDALQEYYKGLGDEIWYITMRSTDDALPHFRNMLSFDPEQRPTAVELCILFPRGSCCGDGPVDLAAYREIVTDDDKEEV